MAESVHSPYQLSNLLNSLMSLVEQTSSRDIAVPTPCGKTISGVAADKIYRGMRTMNGTEMVEDQEDLPLCGRKVRSYYSNSEESHVENDLGARLEAEKNPDIMCFPGVGTNFVVMGGNWEIFTHGDFDEAVIRTLDFASQTSSSLFKKMSIQGHRNGDVTIWIEFEKTAISYLSRCGIALDDEDEETRSYRSNKIDTKLLFEIIAKHIQLPADKLPLIRDLVASGNWKTVTPH